MGRHLQGTSQNAHRKSADPWHVENNSMNQVNESMNNLGDDGILKRYDENGNYQCKAFIQEMVEDAMEDDDPLIDNEEEVE